MNTDAIMAERFARLKTTRTTRRGNKYLLPPDHKDSRWGLHHFGGVEAITDRRATKLLDKMEKWQAEEKAATDERRADPRTVGGAGQY